MRPFREFRGRGWETLLPNRERATAQARLPRRAGAVVANGLVPSGQAGTVHLAISDPSGDSAIFEFIEGQLVIHHSHDYQVMTNEPSFDRQLALAVDWKNIGGSIMLPGTKRAADRFARMSYYVNEATQPGPPLPAARWPPSSASCAT